MGLARNSKTQKVSNLSELYGERNGVFIVEGTVSNSSGGRFTVSNKDSSISVLGEAAPGRYRLKLNKTTSGFTLISSEQLVTSGDVLTGVSTGRVRVSNDTLMGEVETEDGKVWVQFSKKDGIY